jgi:translation initiation factor 1
MRNSTNESDLVYTTSEGRICPRCGKPANRCVCERIAKSRVVPGDGVVRVGRETKGRKGKGVTVITGVPLPADQLKVLSKQLKRRCGCGGTVRDGVIEIQGEHRDFLVEELKKRGFTVKKAG